MSGIAEFGRRSRYMRHLARERYLLARRWLPGEDSKVRPVRERHVRKLRRYSEVVRLGSARRDG